MALRLLQPNSELPSEWLHFAYEAAEKTDSVEVVQRWLPPFQREKP
ncbi:MAG TPA: hypothetical protein PLD10_07890 [Rhodopila sp.]|nr:hypothetical protein [Rhodopila sp.]